MSSKRKTYVTNEQKRKLLEIMQETTNLNSGTITDLKSYGISWEEVSNILNACGGANKTGKEWRKCWQDMKRNVKEKLSKNASTARMTGGGPHIETPLTDVEEHITPFVGNSAIYGHSDILESPLDMVPANTLLVETEERETFETIENTTTFEPCETSTPAKKRALPNATNCKGNKKRTTERIIEHSKNKLSIEKEYYEKKLALLERDVIAKEKIADALTKISESFS